MTIDERLEKLGERHQALAESVELMGHRMNDIMASIKELIQVTNNHGKNIQKLADNIGKLVDVTNQDAENIRKLARIAELHEKRLDRLEEGQ